MSTASSATTAVLLVNLGTPDAPTKAAVRRYLSEFLHDRRVVDLNRWLWFPLLHGAILPLRSRPVAERYAAIWSRDRGSPLRAHGEDLAAALGARRPTPRVALAMRYGNPSIPSALRSLREAGLRRLLVLPLYPQYSTTTTESVFDAVEGELARWQDRPELRCIRDYHDDAGWIDAMADSIRRARADAPGERLLLSFHGIPERYARRGDPYPQQCEASAQIIAQHLQLEPAQWQLAYQSRFGREPWLGPATIEVLREWARAGVRRVDVACPGFAADCLETLHEIAIENTTAFVAAGGERLRYIPALNAQTAHVTALASLIARHAVDWLE
ncbi:MAG: ferrochelatase [Proteobacteria bacterium]|nr:ferrochelatase [Pseudomonadota bacterium]